MWQGARGHLQIRARLYGYADIIEAVTARVVHLIARRAMSKPDSQDEGAGARRKCAGAMAARSPGAEEYRVPRQAGGRR